jgi:hypothetical protein
MISPPYVLVDSGSAALRVQTAILDPLMMMRVAHRSPFRLTALVHLMKYNAGVGKTGGYRARILRP